MAIVVAFAAAVAVVAAIVVVAAAAVVVAAIVDMVVAAAVVVCCYCCCSCCFDCFCDVVAVSAVVVYVFGAPHGHHNRLETTMSMQKHIRHSIVTCLDQTPPSPQIGMS